MNKFTNTQTISTLDSGLALIRAASCDIEARRMRDQGKTACAVDMEIRAAKWREAAKAV